MKENAPRGKSRAAQAAGYVSWQIRRLREGNNESLSRASLARLRRGLGKAPGSQPELWGLTMEGMPESLRGKADGPSRGEWACYLAMTLFAAHQQGKDLKSACVSLEGQPLGKAVRRLIVHSEDEQRVKRRFDQVLTAEDPEEMAHHLRGFVQLFRAADIPLDYPALAADLYRFQAEDQRDAVRLRWGRDYYAGAPDMDDTENEETAKGEVKENDE